MDDEEYKRFFEIMDAAEADLDCMKARKLRILEYLESLYPDDDLWERLDKWLTNASVKTAGM